MTPLVPFLPETAPFSSAQRAWLNGFLAGLYSRAPVAPAVAAAPAAPPLVPLTILFGSQTGTAEALAKRAAKEAGRRQFAATVLDMAQTDPVKLAAEKNVLVIASTHGEGEPPDNARALHAALRAADASALAGLRFSVCALGDRNYTQFCRCGRDFDAYLEKLGAQRVAPRADCDVEYEAAFAQWLEASLAALATGTGGVGGPASHPALAAAPPVSEIVESPGYTRAMPYAAPVLAVRRLSGSGSQKEIVHVAFSLADSVLDYEAGDALGVWPQNCPELVAAVLAALGCDGEEAVPTPGGELPLRAALLKHYDLGRPAPELQELFATANVGTGAGTAAAPTPSAHDVLDLLLAHPRRGLAPGEFVAALRKLQPRLYSISSSPRAHPGEVHLTVGAVRYDHSGRSRKGVCSTFLAERAQALGKTGVYVHRNAAFKPPADGARPMIMVGPGTGIAPFRAFLHERRAAGVKGRNWLFFGDQHAAHDFIYREELEALRAAGTLHRLDTAFSRDQTHKVYVQDRLRERGAEVFRWLEEGAHFYVCGDAARMAKDVDAALLEIAVRHGGLSADAASAYVQRLRAERRYARDVY